MKIGKKIRFLRKAKKMKLLELAERTGIQIATLSRIEHEKMTGTLGSHIKIAEVLGVDLTELYSDLQREARAPKVKEEHQTDIFVQNNQSSYEILSPGIRFKKMMPILMTIDPEGHTIEEKYQGQEERFVYVLEGEILARIDNKEYQLTAGNTIYFHGNQPHKFSNPDKKKKTKLIIVTSPVSL